MRRMMIAAASMAALAGAACLGPPARAASCTNASLSGAYAASLRGSIGRVVVAGAAPLTADANGGLTGVITLSKNGFVRQALSLTGSYSVNGDCTGVMTLNVTGFAPQHFQFVLSGGGTGFFGVQTDFPTTVTLTGKQ